MSELRLYAMTCGWLTAPTALFLAGEEGTLRIPVPCYLIDHPHGRVLFDSGMPVAAQTDPGDGLGPAAPFFQVEFRQGEELAARLEALEVDVAAAFLVRALDLPAASQDYFIDDETSIFEDDINRLAEAEITKGCNPPTNDLYCPDTKVSREQMAAFLVRALGLTDDGGGNTFIDDDGSIFESDIAKLAAAGITQGCNPPANTMFCPTSTVTRDQMAAFLHRALS